MSANLSGFRHTHGFDIVKPLSIGTMIAVMLPLILLPLASIFIFGTSNGLASFWAAFRVKAFHCHKLLGDDL